MEYEKWSTCNDLVQSSILNATIPEIAQSFSYAENAAELWSVLKKRFDVPNGPILFLLKKRIMNKDKIQF